MKRCKSILAASALLALTVGAPLQASAQVLTYGGDLVPFGGSRGSFVNRPGSTASATAFGDFQVAAGTTWTVTGVFGTFFISAAPFTPVLNWEIRQNMSSGAGVGNVVASGSGAFTLNGDQGTIATSAFNLVAGTYWLGIYADLTGVTNDGSFGVWETSGANSVNALSNNQSYWLFSGGSVLEIKSDLSLGVLGTSTTTVPEPATVTLLAIGFAGMLAVRRRRA